MKEAEALYEQVKSLTSLEGIGDDPSAWVNLVAVLMRIVKRWRQPGKSKKAMVMLVLQLVIDRNVPESSREAANAIVKTLSNGIDLAVQYQRWRWPRITCCSK